MMSKIKKIAKKILARLYRIRLKNRDFSILANNCWGGAVYDKYALQYRTPTIGLWFAPKDFLKFLSKPEYYLAQELKQISYLDSHVRDTVIERKKSGRYRMELDDLVIGRLDDVDMVFLHYTDFQTAKEKWNRRRERLNFDNLIVKMNDSNDCTEKEMLDFLAMDYKHKIFITAKPEWAKYENTILIREYEKDGYVVNDAIRGIVPLNTTKYLNDMLND